MCDTCHTISSDEDIVGWSKYVVPKGVDHFRECLRPMGHKGPHLIRRHKIAGRAFVLFQTNLCCGEDYRECPGCQSEDPEDWCEVYREISLEEAQGYITDPERVGEGWDEVV